MSDDVTDAGDGAPAELALARRSGRSRSFAHRRGAGEPDLPFEGRLGSFERGTGWLNSSGTSPADLRGRVVLVDFWTYTCVNWLRTLPYLRAWDAVYRDSGLTIVGVHTPEFGFEHDRLNVVAQCRDLGIAYPVLLDDHYGVWDEYANQYWPAVYLADVDGRVRYHHFGEGEYAATEMVIQRLLMDAGRAVDLDLVEVAPAGLEVPADWRTLRSPETYLGYGRSDAIVGEEAPLDRPHRYRAAVHLPLNAWDVEGVWTHSVEAIRLEERGGKLRIRFHARDVNLVMAPGGRRIRFVVRLDGSPVSESKGTDVSEGGRGELSRPGVYQLIRQAGNVRDRTVEIEFLDAGAEAFCFTFG